MQNTRESFQWFVKVKNISSKPLCFLQFNKIEFKAANGETLSTAPFQFIHGSVGQVSLTWTNTCLASGEFGYFAGIEALTGYSDVTSIEIASSEYFTNVSDPGVSIIPQSYKADNIVVIKDLLVTYTLDIQAKNTGSIKSSLTGFNFYILLDSNLDPLLFGFLTLNSVWDKILLAGQSTKEGYLITNMGLYSGIATKLLVYLDLLNPDLLQNNNIFQPGIPKYENRQVNLQEVMDQRNAALKKASRDAQTILK